MKKSARLIGLLLSLALLAGCAPQKSANETAPETSGAAVDYSQPRKAVETEQALSDIHALGTSPDDNYRTWYEIFVYSFCDSDGDGIGDLTGVVSKLDYLQELGINGIWLMPVHPSTSYHKYNVSDYYAVDPDYGTMEDMETLLYECEKRDIHVILDLVVNHTGSAHPWFQAAVSYLQSLNGAEPNANACPYLDYYFFRKEGGSGYSQVAGTDWYYEARFSPDMPDLNWDSESVRQEVADIMAFWLDKGAAGFRLDAAKEFFSGNPPKNQEVLSWLQETAVDIDPDCYLVAEVWDSFSQIADYYNSGIFSIFNYAFGNANGKIISVIRGAGNPPVVSTYAAALEKADKAYRASNENYIDAPFLSNHDVGRITGFCGQDANKTKLAGAMNLLMSGSAFLYYGEEIGMVGSGSDPSKRAPMVWNEARNNGTAEPPPQCILPESYPFGSLETQKDDDGSIYNYYRRLIAVRQALPVISHGRTVAEAPLNVGCISGQRKTWGEEECIILMNIDENSAVVDLSAYAGWKLAASLSANGQPITMEDAALNLCGYGVAVLIPAE